MMDTSELLGLAQTALQPGTGEDGSFDFFPVPPVQVARVGVVFGIVKPGQ
jgi:hypothetical protein